MPPVHEVCRELRFPDARLARRLEFIWEACSRDAQASFPQAFRGFRPQASAAAAGGDGSAETRGEGGAWSGGGAKAAYRFFSNRRVEAAEIVRAQAVCTARQVAPGGTVLVVQDTTSFNFSARKAARGMGYLQEGNSRGFFLHTCLAASPQDGTPLGLVAQWCWTRPDAEAGKRKDRDKKPTEDKESVRWLEGVRLARERLPDARIVNVADREGDVYDLFVEASQRRVELLGRVRAKNRIVRTPEGEEMDVAAAVRASTEQATLVAALPRGDLDRPRTATLALRWRRLDVPPPSNREAGLPTLAMDFLLVDEESPPEGVEPIRWMLLTTSPIQNGADAAERLRWYTYRWRIEQFHHVLKSGCRIEERQLQSFAAFERAVAAYSFLAADLLALAWRARSEPEASCEELLPGGTWRLLWKATRRGPPPSAPPSLRSAVRMIATLGGFLGRKSDGEPGVKTIWLGLKELHAMQAGWEAAQDFLSTPP